jgi:hypothetical protein
MASALMVAYRDESGYADSLGILSAGPLGGFAASMVVTNADGYRYVVAPMVDGYLWHAFVNLIWPLLMLSFGPTWPLFRLPSQTQFLDPLP